MFAEQNKNFFLAVIMTLVVVTLLWMVFRGGSGNSDMIEASSAYIEMKDSVESAIEPINVVEAMQSAQFEEISDQQKQRAQQQFDLATEHLLVQDWQGAETLLDGLVNQYPSLVEPYINLAFVYARTNRLSDAREILVRGIGANRNYDILFANLQSIHGAMAAEAYRTALISEDMPDNQLADGEVALNLSLVSSLELSKVDEDLQQSLLVELKEIQTETQSADSDLLNRIANLEAQLLAANSRNEQQETGFAAELAALEVQLGEQSLALAQVAAQQPISAEPVVANEPDLEDPVNMVVANADSVADEITEVEKAIGIELVEEWAARWSAQDVQGYIKSYIDNYRPNDNQISHSEWRDQRQVRLTNKQFINVDVTDFEFEESDNQFSVIFSQRYRSNTMDDTISKKLVFTKNDESWRNAKIIDEVIVRQ